MGSLWANNFFLEAMVCHRTSPKLHIGFTWQHCKAVLMHSRIWQLCSCMEMEYLATWSTQLHGFAMLRSRAIIERSSTLGRLTSLVMLCQSIQLWQSVGSSSPPY